MISLQFTFSPITYHMQQEGFQESCICCWYCVVFYNFESLV